MFPNFDGLYVELKFDKKSTHIIIIMNIGNISGMLRLFLMFGLMLNVSANNLLNTYSPLSLVNINAGTFGLKDSDQTDFLIGS